MKTTNILLWLCLLLVSLNMPAQNKIGIFDINEDIGKPVIKGTASFNEATQEYTIAGAGSTMWYNADQFHFLAKKITGDFTVSATVRFVGTGVEAHRKIGIMARNALTGNSAYADACEHGNDLTSLQFRTTDTSGTDEVVISSFHPTEIELQRIGNKFIFSAATFGENYKSVSKEINLNDEVYAGFFICSHNEKVLEKAIFSNVRITIPPQKNYKPGQDYIGSHLEIMNVETGVRKIIYSVPNSIQAPNWTKDGKTLVFNSEGKIFSFDLTKNTVTQLNTGTVINNNNDHVLSFDGKRLGLSSFESAKRTSTILTVPIDGSETPTIISSVDSGHSYLHGWSPDGKKLVFTGERNKQFNIYAIDIATKKETRLTNFPTLSDGPEYTPDGKYIYFNSVRTGTMKIWRMQPDGSAQEQISFDEYNDWFPHISPNGKQIVYLSFPKEINPSAHPWYQKVYLRLMPSAGGVPRTIAYLFGGQGTINVPSWSPDNKYIAFVSNTKL